MDTMPLAQVPIGSLIEWDGRWWRVVDIRRHAMTQCDNTAWLILEGWKAMRRDDPPTPTLDTLITVCTSFT